MADDDGRITLNVSLPRERPVLLRRDPQQRLRVAAWLREQADNIARGIVEADAVMLVLSEGEVHRAFWHGGYTNERALDAANSLRERVWAARMHSEYDAEAEADRRRANRVQQRQQHIDALAAKPFVCSCKERYATDRGFQQHLAIMRKQEGQRGPYLSYCDPDGKRVSHLSREFAEETKRGDAIWIGRICEVHVLAEVYEPPRAEGLRLIEPA